MRNLTVLIDMDDTMENLCEVWVECLNEKHGMNVSVTDVREWDMTKAFPSLSREEVFAPLLEEALWDRITPVPGAVENIQKMMEDGHKIVVVTSSHPDTVRFKFRHVLNKYFPFIPYDDVVVTSQKQLVKGDILIDDAHHNLEGGEYYKVLFDAPHNWAYEVTQDDMIRVHNWDEIYQIVNAIANLKEW